MTLTTSSRPAPRAGFSLVELMVVIGIITVLVAITGVALQKTVEGRRNAVSREQVTKLQQSLDAEYERIVRQCADDQRNKKIDKSVMDYAENDPNRALAIWTALKLRQHFPDSFAEALSPVNVSNQQTGQVVFSLKPLATFEKVRGLASNGNEAEETGALLYIILTDKTVSGGGAMASSADDLGQHRRVNFVTRQGGTKDLETFVDGWNNSVGFRRWEKNQEIQSSPYTDGARGNRDPLDPKNLVYGWADTVRGGPTGDMSNPTFGFTGVNRMITAYSVGKDQTLGTSDDLFGYRLRQYGNTGSVAP